MYMRTRTNYQVVVMVLQVKVYWLVYFVFGLLALYWCWHRTAKSPCCISMCYVRLVVCDRYG